MDARFARKTEKPKKGIKWADTTKQTQAIGRTGSEHNPKQKNFQICCTKLIQIVQNKQVFQN